MSSQSGSTWGDRFVFKGDGSGQGVNGELWSFVRRFSDAEVKALPSTPLALTIASGADYVWTVQSCTVMVNSNTSGYTNISPSGYLYLDCYGSDYVGNDPSCGFTDLDTLLGTAGHQLVVLRGQYRSEINGTGTLSAFQTMMWGVRAYPITNFSAKENVAVNLVLENAGAGNLTGGNAANGMLVQTVVMRVPVPSLWASLYP